MAHQFTDFCIVVNVSHQVNQLKGKQITLPLTATETNNTHGSGALFLSPFFL